jgi:hypothetical protein
MPSPFPGMDPWLEGRAVFPDLHNSFIAYLREALNAILPPPYFAAIGTRVVIEGDADRLVEPDVDVLRPAGANGGRGPAGGGGVATAGATDVTPIVVHVSRDEATEWLVEVRTGDGDDELVTTVEVLSRANKRAGGEDRAAYLRKQREMAERGVNMVEADLLRGGAHTTAVPLGPAVAQAGPFDYHVCVYRADRPADFEVYPIRLPQRLPVVAVPLRPTAAAAPVNLQPVLDRCYDAGLYARRTRYDRPPDPPLTPEQGAWAEGVLRAKGLIPVTDGGVT